MNAPENIVRKLCDGRRMIMENVVVKLLSEILKRQNALIKRDSLTVVAKDLSQPIGLPCELFKVVLRDVPADANENLTHYLKVNLQVQRREPSISYCDLFREPFTERANSLSQFSNVLNLAHAWISAYYF